MTELTEEDVQRLNVENAERQAKLTAEWEAEQRAHPQERVKATTRYVVCRRHGVLYAFIKPDPRLQLQRPMADLNKVFEKLSDHDGPFWNPYGCRLAFREETEE